LIVRNICTSIWLLVLVLCLLGIMLGCNYGAGNLWQGLGFYILYFISTYISWPSSFFITKEGHFLLDSHWHAILTVTISLGTCIAIDFLLRKFLWNKIQKTKAVRADADSALPEG